MINNIEHLVRQNIKELKPYSCARSEFKGQASVFLDANENPFGEGNRYPDPQQWALKQALARSKSLNPEHIFIGNGSDEVIDLAIRIFCEPGSDAVVVCPPTYGMYEVSANINNVRLLEVPLHDNFQLNVAAINNTAAKIVFLCSPNNPTGNCLVGVEEVLKGFKGIVLLDEAYIDFAEQASFTALLAQYPNLIVSQTFSKAWGKAAIRVGVAYASSTIVDLFNKVKPPYNVSALNQLAALETLQQTEVFEANLATILAQRKRLEKALPQCGMVKHIFPSDANFLLVEMENADDIYKALVAQNIIVRNRSTQIANCLRITVGTEAENDLLLHALKELE